jgi:hypothetical protein
MAKIKYINVRIDGDYTQYEYARMLRAAADGIECVVPYASGFPLYDFNTNQTGLCVTVEEEN